MLKSKVALCDFWNLLSRKLTITNYGGLGFAHLLAANVLTGQLPLSLRILKADVWPSPSSLDINYRNTTVFYNIITAFVNKYINLEDSYQNR